MFLTLQALVEAQFQSGLGHPLEVEEAKHVGEQAPLGINPLRSVLEVDAIDAQRAQAGGQRWLDVAAEADAGAVLSHALHQLARWNAQQWCQLVLSLIHI